MSNKEIEKMLLDAKDMLPTTKAEWEVPQTDKVAKVKWHKGRMIAACFAVFVVLVLGGGTVYANMEMNIAPGEYEQWTDVNGNSLGECESQLGKRNALLPENFGSYAFCEYRTTYVAQHGATYWEALTKNLYNPLYIYFTDTEGTDSEIAISVGTIENDWWQEYYGFEKAGNRWKAIAYTESFTYCGIVIYGMEEADGLFMSWKWVDEDNRNCWSVSVPMEAALDSQEIAKEIVASNTTFWPEHMVALYEKCELFEGFSLAEYKTEDGVSPAIYNGDVYIVFYEKSVEIIDAQSEEMFEVPISSSVCSGLECGNASSIMYDVNGDGVDEIVFASYDSGTNVYLYYVDIIDLKNQSKIQLDYNVEMLVEKMPQIEIIEEKLDENGEKEALVISYQVGDEEYTQTIDLEHVISKDFTFQLMPSEQDGRFFNEDGTIRVDTSIGFSSNGIYLEDYLGYLVGTLVYDPQEQAYVFDKDSVRIEWDE